MTTRRSHWRRAAALAVAAAATTAPAAHAWRAPAMVARWFPGGAAPVTVGVTPRPLRGVESDDCAACHATIAAEWRASLHAGAWRDPLFQSSYAREPAAFCRNCHAPTMAPGAAEPDARAAREGVSCAVCHVRDGRVLGTGAQRGDAPPRDDPHALDARPELAASAFCGGCHQFDFPVVGAAHLRGSGEPMQDTLGEWSRSTSARRGETCQDCHMPWRTTASGQRYRSHAFVGLGDATLMRGAVRVTVDARRTRDAVVVRVALAGDRIGHAFPSGDLFREAAVTVWRDGDLLSRRVAYLGRRYGATASRRRHQVADTRVVPPGVASPREVTLTLPVAPAGATLRWRVEHLRMPVEQALRHHVGDAQNRTVVAEGARALP